MYGKRLLTKADREAVMNSQIQYLEGRGYTHDIYKELHILHQIDPNTPNVLNVQIFKEGAGHPLLNKRYKPIEYGLKNIENVKSNYDSRQAYKAAQPNRKTAAANCAAAIRAELKAAFVGVKFSVTSDTFSGGNSVHIDWTDGPTVKEVEAITSKYQYGHFNGMEDLYEDSNSREDIPQAKYIQEQRRMSDTAKADILAKNEYLNDLQEYEQERKIYPIFAETSYYQAPKKEEPKQPTPHAQDEAKKGTVNIVSYSDKSFAVIGEFSSFYDDLINLGGRYNKFLKCGRGIIFSLTKLEAVTSYFERIEATKADPETTQPDPDPTEAEDTEPKPAPIRFPELEAAHPLNILDKDSPQYSECLSDYIIESTIKEGANIIPTPPTSYNLESFTILWHEGKMYPNYENKTFTNWEDIQRAFLILWAVNERGQDAGYTKVKVSLKLAMAEPIEFRIDITGKEFNGDFNPSLQHICDYLKELEEYEAPTLQAATPTQQNTSQITGIQSILNF